MARAASRPGTTLIHQLRDGELRAYESPPGVFVVGWHPHRDDHPDYPSVTLDSEHERMPVEGGLDSVIEWARQRFGNRDPRDLYEVWLEAGVDRGEVMEIQHIFDEAGAAAIVIASVHRRSAAPDLPWILMVKAPLAAFFMSLAAAAGKDAWEALKHLAHRLYEAGRGEEGSISLEADGTTIVLDLDLPDTAYKELVAGLPPGRYYVWDSEKHRWQGH